MKRASGVLLHISCLPSGYSVGSFGREAERFIDLLAEGGFSFWQVLPFCMTGAGNSPYSSPSAFSGNPFFIDLTRLSEEGLLTADELEAAREHSPYVAEFERLWEERVPLLFRAAARAGSHSLLDGFLNDRPQIRHFCRFMAYRAANPTLPWHAWQGRSMDEETYYGWAFIEYTFFRQWERVRAYAARQGVGIIGDIPIYVAADSADVYAYPELFELDADSLPAFVAGVPPDYFSEDGQLWGNPIYNWDRMQGDGYAWWCDRMRHMLSMFDGVRIDHFRGFDTYYSIPYGAKTAREGEWRRGPGKELIDRLRSVAGERLIIAEDLGEQMPSVEELLAYSGFPGMRVFEFAFLGDKASRHLPHNFIKNSVAYTGTHDNNTLLGYLYELSEEKRHEIFRYCGYEGQEMDRGLDSILRTLLASTAELTVFPVQDLLGFGADTRMNTPGVERGNWGFRVTEEQLSRVDTARLLSLNRLYGRA